MELEREREKLEHRQSLNAIKDEADNR